MKPTADKHHEDWRQAAHSVNTSVGKAIIGQESLISLVTVALLARGHALLEGDVGVGKTTVLSMLPVTPFVYKIPGKPGMPRSEGHDVDGFIISVNKVATGFCPVMRIPV